MATRARARQRSGIRTPGIRPRGVPDMDEFALRELIQQVCRGRLTRRAFVQAMSALGVAAPIAAQMLAAAGVARAQPPETGFTPVRRGGGGDLKILMWDSPTMLHPHFGRGLRDVTTSRLFYEPLAAPAPDGTFVPVLADTIPTLKNGGLSKDGQSVVWRLKKNVVWHDGTPFTADDVIFNWTFAIDPANATSTRAAFDEVSRVEKIDSHTVKVVYKKPQPFWATVYTSGGLLPRHIFEPLKGATSRDAIGMIKPVGTGPYKLVEFKPGDHPGEPGGAPRPDHHQLPQRAGAVPVAGHVVGVQRRQGQPDPRPGRLGARNGRGPRQGRQATQDALPGRGQRHGPEGPGRDQAGRGPRGHRDRGQGRAGLGVLLLRREQHRHQCPLPRGSTDLHELRRARSPVVHGPVRLVGAAVTGEQVERAEHRAVAQPGLRPAVADGRRRDGPREARRAVHPHERHGRAERSGDPDHLAQRAARRR